MKEQWIKNGPDEAKWQLTRLSSQIGGLAV
jgi:hypothetical protein